jgi:hypothetical protein
VINGVDIPAPLCYPAGVFIAPAVRRSGSRSYTYYKLVESVRTSSGPRQRTILSLGRLEGVAPESLKLLAKLIERQVTGTVRLLPPEAEGTALNEVAEKIAALVVRKHSVALRGHESIRVVCSEIEASEAVLLGPVYVGLETWKALGMDELLAQMGLTARQRMLAAIEVIGRLVEPRSELATSGWVGRTALADLLGRELEFVNKDALYRVSDRLWERRERIEAQLRGAERDLLGLEETMVLYDLTSTYFEGLLAGNPKAQRGYSRDGRGDCKQVVVGMVLDEAGFPKASETWRGDTNDTRTLEGMLDLLEKRTGKREGITAVMDRGIASAKNIKILRDRGYHYVVALAGQSRRKWIERIREGPFGPVDDRHPQIQVLCWLEGHERHLAVRSEPRIGKDRGIRERFMAAMERELTKLQAKLAASKADSATTQTRLGRLRQRYQRASRFFLTELAERGGKLTLSWSLDKQALADAALLDGVYILKTDRKDLNLERFWGLYMMLSRVESSFRYLKSSLGMRPIFHHLERRGDGHIFISVLAYHLLHTIEQKLLAHGDHRSWPTINDELQTHRVLTITLPTPNGRPRHLRLATNPTAAQKLIYEQLGLSGRPLRIRCYLQDPDRSAESPERSLRRKDLRDTVLKMG